MRGGADGPGIPISILGEENLGGGINIITWRGTETAILNLFEFKGSCGGGAQIFCCEIAVRENDRTLKGEMSYLRPVLSPGWRGGHTRLLKCFARSEGNEIVTKMGGGKVLFYYFKQGRS